MWFHSPRVSSADSIPEIHGLPNEGWASTTVWGYPREWLPVADLMANPIQVWAQYHFRILFHCLEPCFQLATTTLYSNWIDSFLDEVTLASTQSITLPAKIIREKSLHCSWPQCLRLIVVNEHEKCGVNKNGLGTPRLRKTTVLSGHVSLP